MITDPWLLDPVCACCKNMAWAAEQDMLIRDCEKCKSYRECKWCADGEKEGNDMNAEKRAKVYGGLRSCRVDCCSSCPYDDETDDCRFFMMTEASELIEEQENKINILMHYLTDEERKDYERQTSSKGSSEKD